MISTKLVELLLSRSNFRWRSANDLSSIEHRIRSQMRRSRGKQLLFSINQIRCVERGQLEAVAVRDGVRGAGLNAISAKNAAVVVNVIDLSVALGAAYAIFGSVLSGLNVNAVGRAVRRAQKAGHALLQAVFVALEDVNAAKTLLKLRPAQRPRPVRVVLDHRRLEHLFEGDAHALRDGGDIF